MPISSLYRWIYLPLVYITIPSIADLLLCTTAGLRVAARESSRTKGYLAASLSICHRVLFVPCASPRLCAHASKDVRLIEWAPQRIDGPVFDAIPYNLGTECSRCNTISYSTCSVQYAGQEHFILASSLCSMSLHMCRAHGTPGRHLS